MLAKIVVVLTKRLASASARLVFYWSRTAFGRERNGCGSPCARTRSRSRRPAPGPAWLRRCRPGRLELGWSRRCESWRISRSINASARARGREVGADVLAVPTLARRRCAASGARRPRRRRRAGRGRSRPRRRVSVVRASALDIGSSSDRTRLSGTRTAIGLAVLPTC